jgi:hypothetical protein
VLNFDFPFGPGIEDEEDDDEVVDLSGLYGDGEVSEGITSGSDPTLWRAIVVLIDGD